MHAPPTVGRPLAVALCLAIAFGLSGCGNKPSSAPETGSAPATSSQSASQEAERPPVDPLDACSLLNSEQVGGVLGEDVTGSPVGVGTDGSNCQFVAADDQAPLALLTTVLETHYDNGFDGFLAEAQAAYVGTTEQVTVAGIDGYFLAGTLEGTPTTLCFVLTDGVVVGSLLPGVEPETGVQAQGLLDLALGVG